MTLKTGLMAAEYYILKYIKIENILSCINFHNFNVFTVSNKCSLMSIWDSKTLKKVTL